MALLFLHSKSARVLCLAQILCFLLLLPVTGRGQTGEIVYVYDELGRLVAVIDVAGEAAVYRYDAVGNLLSISRYSSSVVSVIEFTPKRGLVGTSVTIYGTGFSATANQNAVAFNGVAATVISATATRITTTVPTGATTGPITVTAPGGNATSSVSFVVGESGAPTITDFTPTIGSPGTSVTITGTNYETAPQNNKTKFNATYSSIASATSTTITTSVPANSTSGHISVSTPAGTAVSSADFFVPPAPYMPADVAVTGRMAIGESKVVTISTANKIGLIVFDGVAGQRVSLGMNGVAITGSYGVATVSIYKPNGTLLQTPFEFSSAGHGTPTKVLPVTGTYSILVDPYNANVGNVTLHLSEDLAPPISINGSPVSMTFRPGQNAWLSFSGTAGQRVSVGVNGVSLTGSYGLGTVAIYNTDGTVLTPALEFGIGGNGTASKVLPVTGTYAIQVDPYNANNGGVTLHLSEDLAPPIAINDPPVSMTFRPGQNAWLTFAGTAGQRVSVGINGVTLTGSYGLGAVSIYKPDGTVLQSPFEFGIGGYGTPTQVLPVTGNYAILVDPYNANYGNVTVTLSADVAATISINGPPVTLNLNRAGQNAWVTFDGTAGQRVSVGINGVTLTGSYGLGTVSIYKPDGTVLQSPFEFGIGGHGTPTKVLPVTGTYSILVDPYNANVGNVTVHLSEDLAPPISINGSPVSMTFRPGQNAWLSFSGTAGQRVSVGVNGVSLTGSYGLGTVAIYKPDGTVLHSALEFGIGGHGTASKVLPVTGTYAIQIDPYNANYGDVTATLSEDLAPPITIDGAAVTMTFRPGQNAWLTFDGTAGQRVSVGVSGVTLTGSYGLGVVALYKPDSTVLHSNLEFGIGGHGTASKVLPVTGTYAIQIDPYNANYGNVTATLSEDLAPPIAINDAPVSMTFRPGQNAWLTFAGTAGQRVSIGVSGVTLTGSYGLGIVAMYKPDGTVLQSSIEFGSAGYGTPTQVLPVTGNYSILIDPYNANNGNVTVTLSEDLAPPININDPPLNLNLSRVGQNARLTFAGTAGQQITVRITNNTVGSTTVTLSKPDGTTLTSSNSGSSSFNLAAQTLPTTGTYSVQVDPAGANTGSLSLSLYDPALANANNLAFNKTATQSSTDWSAPASRAVDGNTDGNFWNGSVTHTAVQNTAWWEVDLGSIESIGNIDLWNRTDCCGSALTNFYVFVSEVPFTSTNLTTTINQSGVWSINVAGQGGTPTTLTVNRTGRYVRVQLVSTSERLSLAEVQVWRP